MARAPTARYLIISIVDLEGFHPPFVGVLLSLCSRLIACRYFLSSPVSHYTPGPGDPVWRIKAYSMGYDKVFEMQTAAIRYELGDHHSFEFVEGAIAHPMDPGIKSLVSEHDEFFCYLDETSASSCITALDDLEIYMAAEGPFDAVMAFSQGASLAATLMIQKLWQDPIQQHINPLFKCAVFFSGGIPGDPVAIRRNEPRLLDHATDGEVIQVPTAHIWGSKDPQHLSFGLPLSQLCKNETRTVFTHEGGHEVPGSSSKDAVTGSVNAIRRTVAKAVSAQ